MNLLEKVYQAQTNLQGVAFHTLLGVSRNLSTHYNANILLKREDLQPVRSYKLRGAYNKIVSLTQAERDNGVICASAGNHAQGVAFACSKLRIRGKIVMPATTPKLKVKQVRHFGKDFIDVNLIGDTFDDAYSEAMRLAQLENKSFIHPFDDELVIAGQGTIGLELLSDARTPIDYLFVPVGGGGLAAGLCTVFRELSPHTKIIGVEPMGAPSMKTSLAYGEIKSLAEIDKFVDGAAVKRVGERNFELCKYLSDVVLVPEGAVCSTLLDLYSEEAIVVEPAGALSIAALGFYADHIEGKNVVCVISGSNNDITRMEEIKERSLLYEGLKHYFIINFPQRAGALRDFADEILGPTIDIAFFQYIKKNNRETGPALVGIEVAAKSDFSNLLERLRNSNINHRYLNQDSALLSQLIL